MEVSLLPIFLIWTNYPPGQASEEASMKSQNKSDLILPIMW
jgi:hypothetical protein